MTVSTPSPAAAWVAAHSGDAPPALIARVQDILAADASAAGESSVAESLLKAGETLLAAVLKDGEAGRAVALDLLAADTCVTWAFEAAAAEPGTLPERAESAMRRIAELAR
ncbi:MAG: hypothetical protein KF689_05265 [Gemmatimonadaceae bacterium]|nr:hypothetical protein [Gemmatimonadaceae bacterium]MCW5825417.1 hypothetical protein [Gemmatimonadaceae bacterium]